MATDDWIALGYFSVWGVLTIAAVFWAVWEFARRKEGLPEHLPGLDNDELFFIPVAFLVCGIFWGPVAVAAIPVLFYKSFRRRFRAQVAAAKQAEAERRESISLFRDLRSKCEPGSAEYVAYTTSIELLEKS